MGPVSVQPGDGARPAPRVTPETGLPEWDTTTAASAPLPGPWTVPSQWQYGTVPATSERWAAVLGKGKSWAAAAAGGIFDAHGI